MIYLLIILTLISVYAAIQMVFYTEIVNEINLKSF